MTIEERTNRIAWRVANAIHRRCSETLDLLCNLQEPERIYEEKKNYEILARLVDRIYEIAENNVLGGEIPKELRELEEISAVEVDRWIDEQLYCYRRSIL